MNAIETLKQQHRLVEQLFDQFEQAESVDARRDTFNQIADALAVHATIEEKHFYPTVKQPETEKLLVESVEDHLVVKRGIAELLQMDPADAGFGAKVKELREDVDEHVSAEEAELFPMVERSFDQAALEQLGTVMDDLQSQLLRRGSPRDEIPAETDAPAPL